MAPTKQERLTAERDGNGELPPPWARYPTFERYTIGWRMGSGEDYLDLLRAFLGELGADRDARVAYLRRHPPAPCTWSSWVQDFLDPAPPVVDDDDDDDEPDLEVQRQQRDELLQLGLVAVDIAYPTWLAKQQGIRWPWTFIDSPIDAARHWTRELGFWSRQVAKARGTARWTMPEVPSAWAACAAPLVAGKVELDALDVRAGLRSLVVVLAAGEVLAPWQLGLELTDFADSFDDDMGYVDAFRLWGMSVFDDAPSIDAYLMKTAAPPAWRAWFAEHVTSG